MSKATAAIILAVRSELIDSDEDESGETDAVLAASFSLVYQKFERQSFVCSRKYLHKLLPKCTIV